MSNDVSLDHISSLMEYTGNSFSVNDGLRKGKLSEKDKKVVRHLDEVIASSKPVSKVYRKQVETLIKSDAKEAKTLESLYSKLLSAKKLLKSSLSSRVK